MMSADFIHDWLLLIGVFTVALASPGPDFVMIVRNSILYSRRVGLFTALGFAFGVLIHVAYCVIGIAALISSSALLFSIIKYCGAAYLLYLGIQALRSGGFSAPDQFEKTEYRMTDLEALRSGFITNVLNPKATMFFLALFTQILDPNVSATEQAILGLTCFVMTFLWFSLVATILTTPAIRQKFLGFSKWIDRFCGVIFIGLAVRLALTKI